VVVKLAFTLVAAALLLLHTQPIGHLGAVAAGGGFGADLDGLRVQLVVDAAAALVVLLGTTALAVHKPRGATGWGVGRRNGAEEVISHSRRSARVEAARVSGYCLQDNGAGGNRWQHIAQAGGGNLSGQSTEAPAPEGRHGDKTVGMPRGHEVALNSH
jgi:hypothetical protein